MAYYTAGIIGPYVRDAINPTLFDISSGNITATGTLTVGAFAASNLVIPGYIRNDLAGTTMDISGGNIVMSGTITAGSITAPSTSYDNIAVGGWLRNNLTPSEFDISGGNISNSGTTSTANALVSGYLRNNLTATQFDISGGNIRNVGTINTGRVTAQVAAVDPFMVAVGQGSGVGIATSDDGITWTGRGASLGYGLGVAWNGSLWVVVGDGGILTSDSNATSWTTQTSTISTGRGVAWGGGKWVAVGDGGILTSDSNATSWTAQTSTIGTGVGVAWNGSLWVAVGSGGILTSDSNATSWTARTSSIGTGSGVAWNGSLLVAVGSGGIVTSSTGTGWTAQTSSIGTGLGVAWNGSLWVAVGTGGIVTSSNGSNWTARTSTVVVGYGVAWNGSLWVVVGDDGASSGSRTATSTNGIDWTTRTSPFTTVGYGVASRNLLPVNSTALDVSGNVAISGVINTGSIVSSSSSTSNLVVSGYVRNDLAATQFDISGGNISNSGTTSSTNALVSGYVRNDLTATQFDISGGNIRNTGTTSTANALVSGYLRNNLSASQFDISGGNIRNTGTTSTSNIIATGYLRDALTSVLWDISGGNIRNTGTTTSMTIDSLNVLASGYIRNNISATQFDISGGNISNSGTTSTANALVSGYLRNSLIPSQFDISGGNIDVSGRVLTTSGTVSTPSYTFRTDTSLGLYRMGANQLGFASAGLQRMTISNSNVGIATTVPAYLLDVSGTTQTCNAIVTGYLRDVLTPSGLDISGGNINISGRIVTGAGSVSAPAYTFRADASMGLYDPATNVLGVVTSGVERMRVLADGKVGIATSAASTLFQVNPRVVDDNGYAYDSSAIMVVQPKPTGTAILNDPTAVMYLARQGTSAQSFGAMASLKLSRFENNDVNSRTRLDFDLTHNTFNDAQVMTLRSDGRVGIGTTAPGTTLDISTSADPAIFIRNSSGPATIRLVSSGLTSDVCGMQIYQASDNQGILLRNALPFRISSNTTPRLAIISNGNVGIACNAPQNTLDISASGNFDGIRITAPNPVINMYVRGTEANGNTMQMFANSSNGGLHQFDAARTLNFLTNSTSRMAIGTNGNIAIGAGYSNPAYALDVCSSSTAATAVFRNSSTGQAAIWVTSGAGATYSAGLEMYHDPGTQGLYSTNALPFTVWTGGVRRLTILNTGEVGIGTTSPGTNYGLDVATGIASSAAINMNTWPRSGGSNCMTARGITAYRGKCIEWKTPSVVIDANLATFQAVDPSGSYLVIRKSGIWSISYSFNANSAAQTISIDTCTSTVSTDFQASGSTGNWNVLALQGIPAGYWSSISYTGYLPSNNGLYYKFKSDVPGAVNESARNSVLNIIFHQEMANGRWSTFPVGVS
jgi:hypothetical protein